MLKYEAKLMCSYWKLRDSVVKGAKDFFTKEDGDTNFISIIVVLVIVLGLAALFRKNIGELITGWWDKINSSGDAATQDW